jgi:hypothetical protein
MLCRACSCAVAGVHLYGLDPPGIQEYPAILGPRVLQIFSSRVPALFCLLGLILPLVFLLQSPLFSPACSVASHLTHHQNHVNASYLYLLFHSPVFVASNLSGLSRILLLYSPLCLSALS